jgi:cytochrome c553
VTKSPASLLFAAVLACALPVLAQQPAGPASAAPAAKVAASAPAPAASAPAAAAPVPAAAPQTAFKLDAAAGEAKYTATCAACHGADGNSGTPANPKIAQQHPEYLVKQLQEFKNGKRPSPVMQGFAAQLTDADMKNIGAFLGAKKSKAGFAKDKELVALGEKIYRGGILNRQVAACAGCHSPNGAGIPAQYPRLSGQHADYTASQLVAFRDGARKNSAQMAAIAGKMNDREIRAVADYIAGLR